MADHRTTFIGETDLAAVDLIGRIDTAEAVYRRDQVERAVATTAATKREFTRALQTRQAEITNLFAAYGPLIVDDADRGTWKAAQAHWTGYVNETVKTTRRR
jgi:multidrug resistance efflux pump